MTERHIRQLIVLLTVLLGASSAFAQPGPECPFGLNVAPSGVKLEFVDVVDRASRGFIARFRLSNQAGHPIFVSARTSERGVLFLEPAMDQLELGPSSFHRAKNDERGRWDGVALMVGPPKGQHAQSKFEHGESELVEIDVPAAASLNEREWLVQIAVFFGGEAHYLNSSPFQIPAQWH